MLAYFKRQMKGTSQIETTESIANPTSTQTQTVVFPSAAVPKSSVDAEIFRSYEEVANSIGFEPAALTFARLRAFFETEGIMLYDGSEVNAWLVSKLGAARANFWCWRALRPKDEIKNYGWAGIGAHGFYSSARWECRSYGKLIPKSVLDKVAAIEAKFGESVRFFVTDFVSVRPDPFIMVRPAACHDGENAPLIFDAWDEPGFGRIQTS